MKLSAIKIDAVRAENGDWIGEIPDMEDLELKVRGAQCAAARALRSKLVRALPSKVRTDPGGIPFEHLEEIETRVLHDVVLVDWRNLDDGPYSRELALRFLTDPDYVVFREAVIWAAARVGRDEMAAQEADLGN